MTKYIRPSIQAMAGYTPGEQPRDGNYIKLNTNENPYPPSPRALAAIRECAADDRLRRYPDPLGTAFRQAASRVLDVDPDAILIGNGSDDILTITTRAFVPEGGTMAAPTPSYILYRTLAQIQGASLEEIPFSDTWQPPSPWPAADANLSVLPNPNSPTGTMVSLSNLKRLACECNGPLIIDEAYADFAEYNALTLLAEHKNVVITRTLSKSYALAGIRFGFAIADPALVREFTKVKDSYNCDMISLAAATAAIEDQAYMREIRRKIIATRERLFQELVHLGFEVLPSQANFLWCRSRKQPVKPLYEELKRRLILVRYMHFEGYGDGLRITVGTDDECDRLLAELRKIV